MDEHDVRLQAGRIAAYRKLETELANLGATLDVLNTPTGVHKQSAFTGNTRESRRITGMRIAFSSTLGGEAPVDLNLSDLNLHAGKVGDLLRGMIAERMKTIRDEMAKL